MLFQNHSSEFNEFNCLVSMDRLFYCLSGDGNKRNIEQTRLVLMFRRSCALLMLYCEIFFLN